MFFAKSAEEYDCKEAVECSFAKECVRDRKERVCSTLSFRARGRPKRWGASACRLVRGSRMNLVNTRHVTVVVTITEAISAERSKLAVGWRF